MITKMTKYSFVLLSGEKEGFLEKIQELGVVDITRSVKPVDDHSHEMLAEASRARKVLEFLESLNYKDDADWEKISASTVSIDSDPVTYVEDTIRKMDSLKADLTAVRKQITAREPWGDYDKDALDSLSPLFCKFRAVITTSRHIASSEDM